MATVSEVKDAFADGSGLDPLQLTIVAVVFIILLLLVFGIQVLFKRLQMFQRDNDSFELIKTPLIIFIVFIMVMLFFKILII